MNVIFPLDTVRITVEKSLNNAVANPLYSSPSLQISECDLKLTIDKVATYQVQNGQQIKISPFPNADESSIQLFLNGSAFGALLHQKGIIPFHGCSFELNGKGIVLCGYSGAGKSSVTTAFCQHEARFINDDITPISIDGSGIRIIPIRTQIKLWEDALTALDIESANLKKIRPSLRKFYVPFTNNYKKKIPLHSVVILGIHEHDRYEVVRPVGMEKFNLLLTHIYRRIYLKGMPQTARNLFVQLLKLSHSVTVIHVLRPSVSNVYETKEFIRAQL